MITSYSPCTDEKARCFARAFWQTKGSPPYQHEVILPKGIVELIFSFDDPVPYSRTDLPAAAATPRCFISGMTNLPVQLHAPQRQSFFGIELHPAAVKKLLKTPNGDFLNAITDLELIHKPFSDLWHLLAEANSFTSRIHEAQQWLAEIDCTLSAQELAISGFLARQPGTLNVAGLASQFCYSVRQLHRKSRELFGMSTEGLVRYQRYIHALHLIHQSNEALTGIGYDCQYYDQAHFIREFRDFTSLTPGDYRQQKSRLPGHLYQNVRYVQ